MQAPAKRSQNFSHHIAALLGAIRCARLATLSQRVATCWVLKIELVRMPWCNIIARTWSNVYSIPQHPKMLHEKFDQFQIWANNIQHVAAHCNRVAKRSQHVAPNNVAISYVEMLQSFGQGFKRFFLATFPLLLLSWFS